MPKKNSDTGSIKSFFVPKVHGNEASNSKETSKVIDEGKGQERDRQIEHLHEVNTAVVETVAFVNQFILTPSSCLDAEILISDSETDGIFYNDYIVICWGLGV